jgi:uncharacterized surface protein with fasciclin (FAS1) repeats
MFTVVTALMCGTVYAQCPSGGSPAATEQVSNHYQDIVASAKQAGQFDTLLTALKEAGLSETLRGTGPFTVFAPTDAAFAKLPPGTLAALLKDKQKLQAILTYHVVAGNLQAADVLGGAALKTLQGQDLTASNDNGKVSINNALVLKTDLECSNGVIHVIDTVLLPR